MKTLHRAYTGMATVIVLSLSLYVPQGVAHAAGNPANLVGAGTPTDPFEIGSATDALAFDQNWQAYADSYVQLEADITLPTPSVVTGGNWTPVGTLSSPFDGTFDGNGYTITGLTINNPAPSSVTLATLDATPVGLFGVVEGTVENLNLSGVSVNNSDPGQPAGAVAGVLASLPTDATATPTLLHDTVLSGTVTSDGGLSQTPQYDTGLGGLLGNNGLIVGGQTYTGGLVTESFASADVQNVSLTLPGIGTGGIATATGGLVGSNVSGTVQDSYAEGSVHGEDVGGLIGIDMSTVDNAYSSASVGGSIFANGQATAPEGVSAGGLIGEWDRGTITDTYAVGPVNGSGFTKSSGVSTGLVGGLIGSQINSILTVTSSYYDTDTTGQTSSSGGTPESDAAMKLESTYMGWDFPSTWMISQNTYPTLTALSTSSGAGQLPEVPAAGLLPVGGIFVALLARRRAMTKRKTRN